MHGEVQNLQGVFASRACALDRMLDEPDFFRSLFDVMPLQIVVKEAREGRIIIWNRKAEEWTGIARSAALGMTESEIFGSEVGERLAVKDRGAFEGADPVESLDEVGGEGAGGRRWLKTVRYPIRGANDAALAILIASEEAKPLDHAPSDAGGRRDELNFLRTFVDLLPVGVFARSARDEDFGKALLWNCAMEELSGIRATEAIGGVYAGCPDPGAAESAEKQDREVAALPEPSSDVMLEKLGGSDSAARTLRTVKMAVHDEWGRADFIIGVALGPAGDEELAVEETARMRVATGDAERWDLALASSEAAVWDWNARDDTSFYSDGWQRLFGYSPAELPQSARGLVNYVHPEDREKVRAAVLRHLKGDVEEFKTEYRILCRNGAYRWVLAHAKACFGENGRAIRMIGTIVDISARKEMERQLLVAKEAAEAASKAKGEFLAMMSHEIRTPLNGILGFTELLADSPLNDEQNDHVQTIRESGATLLTILNDILDYSKIESGKLDIELQPTLVGKAIESIMDFFRPLAKRKDVGWRLSIADHVPRVVMTDPVRFRQILMNLLSNALKFTTAGTVSCSVQSAAHPIHPGMCVLHIVVADSGIGIAVADQKELFQPFAQVDPFDARRAGGTGLGLSIVKRLVELMGGTIELESVLGSGTTFSMRLPCEVVEADPKKSSGPISISLGARLAERFPLSILIAEDNEVNRRLVRMILQRWGYMPDEASDGATAVVKAINNGYDLILMDIQMPGMDGYHAARQIRELLPGSDVFIAALTAHAMLGDHPISDGDDLDAYLTKPLKPKELLTVIERAFQERRGASRTESSRVE